ncbi:unnamed protein product [Musa acuminata subsp. burmannicoides]
MAGHRSSLPLRLQQILSGGRAMWPELKLEHDARDLLYWQKNFNCLNFLSFGKVISNM